MREASPMERKFYCWDQESCRLLYYCIVQLNMFLGICSGKSDWVSELLFLLFFLTSIFILAYSFFREKISSRVHLDSGVHAIALDTWASGRSDISPSRWEGRDDGVLIRCEGRWGGGADRSEHLPFSRSQAHSFIFDLLHLPDLPIVFPVLSTDSTVWSKWDIRPIISYFVFRRLWPKPRRYRWLETVLCARSRGNWVCCLFIAGIHSLTGFLVERESWTSRREWRGGIVSGSEIGSEKSG